MTSCETSLGISSEHTNGYARVYDPSKKKTVRAHRFVWEENYGPIPKGKVVMHTCDNRSCTNIEHLRLGTQSENLKDMYNKNRQGTRKFPLGEDHHTTVLSNEQVDMIKQQKYWRGMYSFFAERYGVTRQTISNIYNRRTWKEPYLEDLV